MSPTEPEKIPPMRHFYLLTSYFYRFFGLPCVLLCKAGLLCITFYSQSCCRGPQIAGYIFNLQPFGASLVPHWWVYLCEMSFILLCISSYFISIYLSHRKFCYAPAVFISHLLLFYSITWTALCLFC